MCGRYVSPDAAAIERAWNVHARNIKPFPTNFNVTPTSGVPILRLAEDGDAGLSLDLARWGLIPIWWKQDKAPRFTFNARSEEAATKPMWRTPLSRSRCLVPALGWYEWQEVEQTDKRTGEVKKAKQPHYIHLPDRSPFCFAGLMASWSAPGIDTAELTCAILTQDAAESVSDVHDRMPVVLPESAYSKWLDRDLTDSKAAISLARERAVTNFEHHTVSRRINRPVASDASLIEAV